MTRKIIETKCTRGWQLCHVAIYNNFQLQHEGGNNQVRSNLMRLFAVNLESLTVKARGVSRH